MGFTVPIARTSETMRPMCASLMVALWAGAAIAYPISVLILPPKSDSFRRAFAEIGVIGVALCMAIWPMRLMAGWTIPTAVALWFATTSTAAWLRIVVTQARTRSASATGVLAASIVLASLGWNWIGVPAFGSLDGRGTLSHLSTEMRSILPKGQPYSMMGGWLAPLILPTVTAAILVFSSRFARGSNHR